jgi:hypothetical protein
MTAFVASNPPAIKFATGGNLRRRLSPRPVSTASSLADTRAAGGRHSSNTENVNTSGQM